MDHDDEFRKYDLDEFFDFLRVSKLRSIRRMAWLYANHKEEEPFKNEVQEFRHGEFHMEENYLLGEPLSGQELIWFQDRPIWVMNYFGQSVEKEKPADPERIIEIMKLSAINLLMIYGPGGWFYYSKSDGYLYTVTKYGGINKMNNKGVIYYKDKPIYKFTCYGGTISS